MKVFHQVVINESFTKAAYELNMTVSSVSKAIQQLENSLKTKLLYRTTRKQSLTDSGRDYLLASQEILTRFKELEEQIQQQGNEPSGLLKISAPTALGQFIIAAKMHEFMLTYPKIHIDLILNENIVDITEQGFDLAIRSLQVPKTSPLYSCVLGSHTRKLVASPAYLAGLIMPTEPEELKTMKLLNYQGTQINSNWSFSHQADKSIIQPQAVYTSNNYFTIYKAAMNGLGVANLYQYLVDEDIKKGNLVELLPHWQQQRRSIYGIFQQRRDASPKLDALLSFLSGLFK